MPNASGTIKTVFHADLSDAHAGEDYWVSAAGRRIRLVPHTPASLAAAHAAAPHLKAGRAHGTLTHYAEDSVPMPVHSVVRVHLRQREMPVHEA